MNAVQFPRDCETILIYLAATSLRSAHTRDALHSVCQSKAHADESLTWLVNNGYVFQDAESFELTFSGLHTAQQLQEGTRPTSLRVVADNRPHERAQHAPMPSIDTHPLRAPWDHDPKTTPSRLGLHFVLAFEAPKGVLPIPVLDGDIVGRETDADIHLRHDDYISSRHCRFRVNFENNDPVLSIEDLGSRNGTYVNGARLEKGQLYELQHGTRIHMGSTILIVVKIPY
jgi:hypothetical protein